MSWTRKEISEQLLIILEKLSKEIIFFTWRYTVLSAVSPGDEHQCRSTETDNPPRSIRCVKVLVILTYSKSSGGGLVSWTLESYTTIEEPVIKLIEKAFEEHIAGVFISITKIIVLHFAYSWLSLYSFGPSSPPHCAFFPSPRLSRDFDVTVVVYPNTPFSRSCW